MLRNTTLRSLPTLAVTLLLVALLGSGQFVRAQVAAPCGTDFDDNDMHGYHACLDAPHVQFALETPGPSGNPGDIYLWAKDQSSASCICAGPDCLGDWTVIAATGCGALCYSYRFIEDYCTDAVPECVTLGYALISPSIQIVSDNPSLPRLRAVFRVNFYVTDDDGPNGGWHNICAPIRPAQGGVLPGNAQGQWEMVEGTVADWGDLLSNVTGMRFPVDPTANPQEEVGVDNVFLRDNLCPQDEIPTLTEWGLIIFCALLFGWMAWVIVRRRKAVNVRI